MVHPELIGFGPFFSSQLSLEELQSSLVGRAVADRGRGLLVLFPDGAHPVVLPGRLRAEGVLPVVGDFVVATPGPDRTVTRVLERRTWLSRNVAGSATAEQVLAANVDVVFVVQGLDEGPSPRRLERTLAAVHAGGAEPVIVLTSPTGPRTSPARSTWPAPPRPPPRSRSRPGSRARGSPRSRPA
ncbi:GTPase RsgA [Anaeromyxobacter paludicola]|uniref:EngC GTPase domain-containing protein n=1 Tax=Anaeromyxobacter paludicola TaxID=2918171 RepID=A0ABN6NCF1_9BACT|nr:GTPase RsgA [Anaeromyxobacter paludicola]BDG10761.1 hypothetical protein AMPC_38740 [Anaeromyxobacter paludicola]